MRNIYATDGTNTLLRNNKTAKIGRIYHMGKRLKQDGTAPLSITVEFDFEENCKPDRFFFEDGLLVYNCITLGKKPRGIKEAYEECVTVSGGVPIHVFVNVIKSVYMATQMGFV
jgi:hypothetical protein